MYLLLFSIVRRLLKYLFSSLLLLLLSLLLLSCSIILPSNAFLALLDRAGEHINALMLVDGIQEGTEIPHLKEKLIHILDNYALELELRQGCNTILTSDIADLYKRL